MIIINEIYKILFVASIIYIIFIIGDFIIKAYSRFKLGNETIFTLTKQEKIMLWISLSLFFSYIF